MSENMKPMVSSLRIAAATGLCMPTSPSVVTTLTGHATCEIPLRIGETMVR